MLAHVSFRTLSFAVATAAWSIKHRQVESTDVAVRWEVRNSSLWHGANSQVAVVGNQIFFYSEEEGIKGDISELSETTLKVINLNQTIDVDNMMAQGRWFMTEFVESTGRSTFIHDNTSMYILPSHSAFIDNPDDTIEMGFFNASTNQWGRVSMTDDVLQAFQPGCSAVSAPDGRSFVIGGINQTEDAYEWPLTAFDLSSPSAATWREDMSSRRTNRAFSGMAYLPVGDQGALILIGGYNTTNGPGADLVARQGPLNIYADTYAGLDTNSTWPFRYISARNIDVYDIASGTWFTVPATGDIPPEDRMFCEWTNSAADRSSFTITTYGNWNLFNETAPDDIYVLTVPAFRWIKIAPQNNLMYAFAYGRQDQRCVQYREDNGFMIGGGLTRNDPEMSLEIEEMVFRPPIRLLNLSTYEWQTTYDPARTAGYRVHANISRFIGGGELGGATVTEPEAGFADSQLSAIFSKRMPELAFDYDAFSSLGDDGSDRPSTEIAGGPDVPNPQSISQNTSNSNPNVGAVAGGVVGGILFVSAVIGWLFIRKRRIARKESIAASKVDSSSSHEDGKHEVDGTTARWEMNGKGYVAELQGSKYAHMAELQAQSRPSEMYGDGGQPSPQRKPSEMYAGPPSPGTAR